MIHPIWSIAPSNQQPVDPEDYRPTLRDRKGIITEVTEKCFTPGVTSVITISAPQILLSWSLLSLLLGIGLYFGFIWTRNLDTNAGPGDSRNIMIVYLVSVVVCFIVYSASRLIQDDDTTPERTILFEYVAEYVVTHSNVASQWFSEITRPEDHDEDRITQP